MACWNCAEPWTGRSIFPYYGLGAHHHDLGRTGTVFGSTVFEPQDLSNFAPDGPGETHGTWTHCPVCGDDGSGEPYYGEPRQTFDARGADDDEIPF